MTTSVFRMPLRLLTASVLCALANASHAAVYVQCPGDTNGDAVIDNPDPNHPRAVCQHLTAGDGFIRMGDDAGKLQYTFGFHDVTGVPPDQVMDTGLLAANFPAPTISLKEGDEFYLSLTNVAMAIRPDLADPHSVHFHGFPNASAVFDGMPEGSIAINQGETLTYYYNIVEPGTFIYHCHVEATEHMQMGMLGNLYVHPKQDGTSKTYDGKTYTKFAYNDGDGSTGYDVEYPLQLGSFDPVFHDLHQSIQPLPFANMKDTYAMINGRGYPDTVNPSPLPTPIDPESGQSANNGTQSQKVSSLVTASAGQRVLLRISNLNITNFYTVTVLGLPMKVVGTGAHILRGPTGKNLYYDTSSVTLGGGEAVDVLIDTRGITPGTYFLYTTNLNYLSNNEEDYGGMMTEIVIN
ncbi:multicopper oxidase domain-containing protein [Methylocaldum sp.]|uniref:multicopper oxidase domain-containing protein n=1 Tax=Methylocaldum sp. TaxID=1969727 RepID=UPI002D635274|nr:multicopper oxidase domain-containing protein [Methylocaldum sp.]HYE35905.1 multicopper oxidase domain-containing protein [Methylocaldum sp.]